MLNPFEEIEIEINKLKQSQAAIKWGTVTEVSPFKIKFDGEETSNQYHKPKNYTPVVNDRVCFLILQKGYVCLGAYE